MIGGTDTIAAVSSASGEAARMIVRISGQHARKIAQEMLIGKIGPAASAQRQRIVVDGISVPAWVYVFESPHSYTGENLVELHVPGNPLLARMVLERLMALGARQAEAGEFTARAYFAHRIDLAEAEGVAAIISARNDQELDAARQLLGGELSRRLRPIMDLMAETLALVEAGIDFSDQEISFLDREQTRRRISSASQILAELVRQSARFERLSHEPRIVLAGRPNAGKSTLLNALAGHERAVVSPVPGTTRDVLWAHVRLKRGMIRLCDVAGLEESAENKPGADGEIEQQMRSQAIGTLDTADHVVLVRDLTDARQTIALKRQPDLIVWTKLDLLPQVKNEGIVVSALTGAGLDELRARLDAIAFGSTRSSATLALNARHLATIADAQEALARAGDGADEAGIEIIAMELREALDALGRILGEVSPDDLLGRVFAHFCIGK